MRDRGRFISVEGTEGVGKSTNIAFIRDRLSRAGHRVLVTREPGGTPFAEEIREMLLRRRAETVDPTAELLLMFAARAQHLNCVIEPALAAGTWVVCDRFTDATYAYQGGGRGLDKGAIASLEKLVQGERQPDLTILLNIDVRTGLERARARGAFDRFEAEEVEFFERVQASYLERVALQPERFRVVDAGQPLEQVQSDLEVALAAYLKPQRPSDEE